MKSHGNRNSGSNVEQLDRAYRLWNEHKEQAFEHWLELFADEFTLTSLGGGAPGMEFSKSCFCKDDLVRYFTELSAEWEMNFYRVDEFITQHDRVAAVARCSWTHRRTGKTVDTPKVDLITMRDGKIVAFAEYYDTAQVLACAR